MTPKQIHAALSKMAAHRCSNGEKFIFTKRITKAHLTIIQQSLAALMEKVNYERTRRNFPGLAQPERMSMRRIRTANHREASHEMFTEGMISDMRRIANNLTRAVPDTGTVRGVPLNRPPRFYRTAAVDFEPIPSTPTVPEGGIAERARERGETLHESLMNEPGQLIYIDEAVPMVEPPEPEFWGHSTDDGSTDI